VTESFPSEDYTELECSRIGRVAVVAFNRPTAMNALSRTMDAEFHRALDDAEQDDAVGAIVVTGNGRAFSSGYDLGNDKAEAEQRRSADVLKKWWNIDMRSPDKHWHIMKLAKPVVAAVNGWCLGGGFWYALSADVTIAADDAVFGQPEVREIQNCTFLFAALAGWKHAHRYGLTGDHFDAAEAARIGVVNEVVPAVDLMPAAMKLAERLAQIPADALRINKAITSLGLEAMGLRSAMTIAGALSTIVHSSTDSADLDDLRQVRESEGMRASLKHRDGPFLPEPGGPRSKPRPA
jgi:enoyl-CoA hydratase/carnithine racemase